MEFQVEMTDTFGGEANYSWVKRASFNYADDVSDLALVRRVKRWAGISRLKCTVDNFGDMIAIKPVRSPVVVFINSVQ